MSHTDNNDNQSSESAVGTASRTSKVVSKSGSKQVISIAVLVLVISLILLLMFMGGKKRAKPTQTSVQLENTNQSMILKENEARLAKLRNQPANNELPIRQLLHVDQKPKEDKALLARQNAPTQMYTANVSNILGTMNSKTNTSALSSDNAFSQFANNQSNAVSVVTGKRIAHPAFTIAEGDFIHAVLETAINSDLPGMVRAVVTEPVYAYTGESVIIPAGSRLVGQYDSRSSNGLSSSRVFVMWNRVITPQGVSIMINSPGVDSLGRAGQGADSVNRHFFRMFGTASLLSVIGAVASTSGVSSYDQPNSANQYQQAVGEAFQQAAQNAMSRNLNIKPTLHVHQGNAINVFVARDLDLYAVLGQGA